jgi:hypothetical protein
LAALVIQFYRGTWSRVFRHWVFVGGLSTHRRLPAAERWQQQMIILPSGDT